MIVETIPTAYCPVCKDTGPVVVRAIPKEELSEEMVAAGINDMMLIFCPECESILNLDSNVEVKYYSPEELEQVTGWRVADE